MFELLGLETALVITVKAANLRTGKRDARFVDRCAYESVKLCHDSLGRINHFGLVVEKLDEHESAVLVNVERGVTELASNR